MVDFGDVQPISGNCQNYSPNWSRKPNKRGTVLLQAWIAECDQEKRQLLESAGFSETARLRERLRDGNQRFDLIIYERQLSPREQPGHSLASYYGARPAFQ